MISGCMVVIGQVNADAADMPTSLERATAL